MSVDLKTKYLGLELKNPLVIAACPLSDSLDNLRRIEEAGAAAVVFHSLFEEQITHDEVEVSRVYDRGTEIYAESLSWFPEMDDYRLGPKDYLEKIADAKKKLEIPVIGSLNGTSAGGWIRYAKLIEEAGADALELNVYLIAADIDSSGEEIESRYVDLVSAVKQNTSIPLAVKVGPYFSSPGHMAKKLVQAGADGLVLFNRFLQPDVELESLEISPHLVLSTPYEALLPLRWIAILHGRLNASLALTSGLHDYQGLVKAVMAGADVGMVASVLYAKGMGHITEDARRLPPVDDGKRVRFGGAAQRQHEPAELSEPRSVRARQLHEGAYVVHGGADLATRSPRMSDKVSNSKLHVLFYPQSVAVVGASSRLGTVGNDIFHNLLFNGFNGCVYPINPKSKSILGVHAYACLADVLGPVDLGVLIIPASGCCESSMRRSPRASRGW